MQLSTVINATVHLMSALIAACCPPAQQYFNCAFFSKSSFFAISEILRLLPGT